MSNTDTRTNSTGRSYATILASVVAKRLQANGNTSKAARLKTLDEPLSKNRSTELDSFAPAAVAAARGLIAKVGFDAAVTSIKTMRQHERTGFYAPLLDTPTSKGFMPTPEAKAPQTNTQPTPVQAAEHARHQSHAVDPSDAAATHNEHLKQTANAHADLLASMRTALSNPSSGPVPVGSVA